MPDFPTPDLRLLGAFVALLVLAAVLKSRWFKGWLGEKVVGTYLRRHFDEAEYRIIDDLILPARDGTTQIDHVILSRFGIFVIETKNMTGWIFGDANQASWTQVLHRKKSRFQNPLRQNYGHVKTIETLLGVQPDQVHNVVVFAGDAVAKTRMPANVLWNTRALGRFIRGHATPLIPADQLDAMRDRLLALRIEPGRKSRAAHVELVKAKQAGNGQDGTRCPACGGDMVARTSRKTGKAFFGCTNFPRCRGSRPSEATPGARRAQPILPRTPASPPRSV
ncbi:hypothetical protein HKCCSP123_10970 [Rhodobacterales bacterium HKCCSP123]|nr:hypothetical protein [Rhodobacterales bacterium HKCCSP123]